MFYCPRRLQPAEEIIMKGQQLKAFGSCKKGNFMSNTEIRCQIKQIWEGELIPLPVTCDALAISVYFLQVNLRSEEGSCC